MCTRIEPKTLCLIEKYKQKKRGRGKKKIIIMFRLLVLYSAYTCNDDAVEGVTRQSNTMARLFDVLKCFLARLFTVQTDSRSSSN